MKKLLFFLASACIAFTANAQVPAKTAAKQIAVQLSSDVRTAWEGLAPDYANGDLYAIFVKLERKGHFEIVSVDPTPIAARQRSGGEWEKVPDQSSVLIDYHVWLDPADGGTVHCELTYQYPGWPVRTVSQTICYQ